MIDNISMVYSHPYLKLQIAAIIAVFLFHFDVLADEMSGATTKKVHRAGVVMGLDPGLALRVNEFGTPLYARLTLRLGGCINRRVQLGGDWRMEILVTGEPEAWLTRHEVGPVATFFLWNGWFLRTYGHVGKLAPFLLTAGLGTGYEWGMGRFSGAGIYVGGDVDVRFDGAPPHGYSLFFSFYLTAYDLGTRRGRNEF